MAAEVVGEQVALAGFRLAFFEITPKRHGATPALHKSDGASLEAEVETRIKLVVHEIRIQYFAVAAPDLTEQEKVLPQKAGRPATVLLPEVVFDVFDRIEAETVEPGALRETQVGGKKVLAHLGQLGFEIGQTGEALREVVLATTARLGAAQPGPAGGIFGVTRRVVTNVVVDHVEQHLDAARMGRVHQSFELGFATEAGIEALEIVGPITVVTEVAETGTGDVSRDILDQRSEP